MDYSVIEMSRDKLLISLFKWDNINLSNIPSGMPPLGK